MTLGATLSTLERPAGGLTFLERRPLARAALEWATEIHAGQRRASDGSAFIVHPLEVAALLDGAGEGDDVLVAAAVLHDALERSDTMAFDVEQRFGPVVAGLVTMLSEDAAIRGHAARKRELRERVRDAGHDAAAIFAADKVAKVRELRVALARDRRAGVAAAREVALKTDHYVQSLRMLEDVLCGHTLVRQLRAEIELLYAYPPGAAG